MLGWLTAVLFGLMLLAFVLTPARNDESGAPPGSVCHDSDIRDGMTLGTCWDEEQARLTEIWADQAGEVAYEVEGSVGYYDHRCINGAGRFEALGTFRFSERLPANRNWFTLPGPSDGRGNFIPEYEFRVRAIDKDGDIINRDGFYVIAEPPNCQFVSVD
jgi:hypothetical protein